MRSAARIRTRWFAVGCLLSAMTGAASFFGCVDIFHSTDFGGKANAGPIDFCSWTEETAKANAVRACAYLSACQSPIGDNAAGECIVNATLAYDCKANPNMPVAGEALAFWTCIAEVHTCGDVSSCVYSDPPAIDSTGAAPKCAANAAGSFTACGGPSNHTRVDCHDAGAPAVGEACLATGRGCVAKLSGNEALCLGNQGVTCTKTGCDGTHLDYCVDAGGGDSFDRGIDCASYGGGRCIDAADAGSSDAGGDFVPGCLLAGDAGACPVQPGIRCSGQFAKACASGTEQILDCSALAPDVTCHADSTAPAWDVASVCAADTVKCAADTCTGTGALAACVRGAVVSIDCAGLGLGACVNVATSDGPRAACAAP